MDRMMGIPLLSGKAALTGFDVKEDENAIYLRMDMPGVDKDKVTVCVEGNTLILKGEEGGEREEEEEEEENVRRYSGRIDLPPSLYKVDAIRAELKNGVLKIVVPKVEEEERKAHRYEVKVE
ncbi:HSP20 domain-containing protein [Cephalotus follicularis]|uniref:HSP20 domain-containing protein n=1 Tax=Cephalotus follicularis TaxID=3775 RepID=A0A1Q3CE76_CEPFO|nr:HSP20 domain-containing protein [Cephalotus follicularis]